MKDKIKKNVLAMFLCVVLIINGGISVLADEGITSSQNAGTVTPGDASTVTPGDAASGNTSQPQNNTLNTTVTPGDAQITLELNAVINDNGDEDANTFEMILEAWGMPEQSEKSENASEGEVPGETTPPETSSKLDETTVLKSQISQYFDYYCSCEEEKHTCIEVYTSAWDGSQFLDPVQIYPVNGENTVNDTLTVNVSGKTVEISGFDYNDHMISEGDTSGKGQKLIVKTAVETEIGFWGGNNVPVNEAVTAVYFNNQIEEAFPTLTANVPLSVDIAAQDKTIYYGGSIADTDVISSITAGYKTAGTEEESGIVTVNGDGTLTPAAEWMDDYAVITWNTYAGQDWTAAVGNIFGNAVSKTGTGSYVYAVTAAPAAEAANTETTAGTAISMDGVSDSDTGYVYVLIPVVSFRNTVIYRGYTPDNTYFENYNRVSVEWVEMTGCSLENTVDEDPNTYPAADPGTEPQLYFTYEAADPTFSADTRVNVNVSSSNDNAEESVFVANVAVFGRLFATLAEDDGYEFSILVEYKAPFEMPATGGSGTFWYTFSGMALLMCAALIVLKKRQNAAYGTDM